MPTTRLLRTAILLALLTLAPIAACTDSNDPSANPPPDVTSGAYHGYVQRNWVLPHSGAQAATMGRDLDGDGTIDNGAGMVIGGLIGLGLELDSANEAAFTGGSLVALHQLRADSLVDDASVEWRSYDGLTGAAPRFDGTDRFEVRAETGYLAGMIRGGRAELGWGQTTISLPFFPDQSPIALPLTAAQMTVELDRDGCAGQVTGLIPAIEVDGLILPNLAVEMMIHMVRHPDHEFTVAATRVFDDNGDGRLTVDEILASPVTRGLFRPDVDLDGNGDHDAVSFGLAFDCVPATFSPPGE